MNEIIGKMLYNIHEYGIFTICILEVNGEKVEVEETTISFLGDKVYTVSNKISTVYTKKEIECLIKDRFLPWNDSLKKFQLSKAYLVNKLQDKRSKNLKGLLDDLDSITQNKDSWNINVSKEAIYWKEILPTLPDTEQYLIKVSPNKYVPSEYITTLIFDKDQIEYYLKVHKKSSTALTRQ